MKHKYLFLLVVLAASPTYGKPKEKTYQGSCDRVWAAVKKAVAPPHYNYAQLDDSQKKGIVSTGNTFSGKRYLDITLTGGGDTCTVAIGGNFSGVTHNDKGDLFARIDEAMTETTSAVSPAKTPEAERPQTKENHEAGTETGTGTIVVSAVPDGAEVYVDGNLVGGVPATLKLAPGKHTIRVALSGYKDWSRELSVLASSEAKLTATLEKQN